MGSNAPLGRVSVWIILAMMMPFSATGAGADWEWTSHIAAYLDRSSGRSGCSSLTLSAGNVIGIMYLPMDEQTVQAKVLYKTGERRDQVSVRLMKADARALSEEISALQRNRRTRPIVLERGRSPEGECAVLQVIS